MIDTQVYLRTFGNLHAIECLRHRDQRLVAQAEADDLRGNTGTVYNLGEAIMSTLL